MDDDQMLALLQRVLLDRKFREAVKRDAPSAFATLGILLNPKDVPPEGVKWPPKKFLIAAVRELADHQCGPISPHRVWLPCREEDCA